MHDDGGPKKRKQITLFPTRSEPFQCDQTVIYYTESHLPHTAQMATLPPLSDLASPTHLAKALSTLFEPSPSLHSLLVPSVALRLTADFPLSPSSSTEPASSILTEISPASPPIASYAALVDLCERVAQGWTWDQKADFVGGHPMIGEVKVLSTLSGAEQGGAVPTPRPVLDRWVSISCFGSADEESTGESG
jgi:hypothetical protein